jgi:hypothetical protein
MPSVCFDPFPKASFGWSVGTAVRSATQWRTLGFGNGAFNVVLRAPVACLESTTPKHSLSLSLFSLRAGTTPDEVIASIDRNIGVTQPEPSEAQMRRQAIIDGMLRSAVKAEQAARRGVKAMLAIVGL